MKESLFIKLNLVYFSRVDRRATFLFAHSNPKVPRAIDSTNQNFYTSHIANKLER